MPHKASEHDEWAKKKKDFYKKKKTTKSANTNQSGSGGLELSDTMKQALMTEGNMTADQAKACWSKVVSEN